MNHAYMGTEHLLLGLLAEGDGAAALSLRDCGVTHADVRARVQRLVGIGESLGAEQGLPTTARLRRVLETALREALGLGHNYIGTEHLLLGLVRQGEGVGTRILGDMLPGDVADACEQVRVRVLVRLGRARSKPPLAATPPLSEFLRHARAEAEFFSGAASVADKLDRAGALLTQLAEQLRGS